MSIVGTCSTWHRMLGTVTEAEDVVQEAFARLLREDIETIEDVRGWLVVVTTRLSLDQLRSAREAGGVHRSVAPRAADRAPRRRAGSGRPDHAG